jgi:hypothetical protein
MMVIIAIAVLFLGLLIFVHTHLFAKEEPVSPDVDMSCMMCACVNFKVGDDNKLRCFECGAEVDI